MASLKQHYKTNLKLALPVMIGQLGHIMASVADSMMVGQLGTLPLAAAALANSIFSVFMVFGIGMAYGITPLIANADGKRRLHLQKRILHHGFWMNLAAGLLIFGLVTAFVPMLGYMGQDEGVIPLAGSYLFIISSSVIPLMMFLSFKQFAEGLSQTSVAMFIIIVCNLINIGLNYLLIYGKMGFPALGLNGAGWATLISRLLMFAMMYAYVMYHKRFAPYLLHLFSFKFNMKVVRRILQVGIPSGLQYIFEVSAFSLAAVFAGLLGANAIAAHYIAINIASVSYMAATGLGAAATVRVGNQVGRKDASNLHMAARSLFIMTIAWMAFAGVVILIFRKQLAAFYSNDPEVLAIAAPMLIVVVLFQLSDGLQATGLGALRGFTDVKIPTMITFVTYWVITLPAAYCLSQYTSMEVMGIWYALAGGLTISAVLLLSRFYMMMRVYSAKWEGRQ
jgi:multidrug resistance protein, MATE family